MPPNPQHLVIRQPSTSLRHWNHLIQSLVTAGAYSQCLHLYSSLLASGRRGDAFTFPFLMKSCAGLGLLRLGRSLHAHTVLTGFAPNTFVQTSMLDMYAKCSCMADARRLFDEMPHRSVVSWNCMVSAYSRNSQLEESIRMFNVMRDAGIRPNASTLIGVVSGCVNSVCTMRHGMCVYGYGMKVGLDSDLPISNSVLTMFVKASQWDVAQLLFDSMETKSIVTWSAMASGYVQMGDYVKVFDLFNCMRRVNQNLDSVALVNLISASLQSRNLLVARSVHALVIQGGFEYDGDIVASLVNLYAKSRDLVSAREVFDSVQEKNVVLWTSMISGYVECGYSGEAFQMFDKMLCSTVKPNEATISTVLSACANLGSASLGEKVEKYVIANGLKSDLQVSTGLIHMYCKCGSVVLARKIFDVVTTRDLTIWSTMINGYACHGKGSEALLLFKEMQKVGIEPDAIVFTHVLTACNHSGLVDEGLEYFHSMKMEYGIEPSIEHYMCIVDLLCKAGHFNNALRFFQQIPIQLQNQVLAPMISAFSAHCAASSVESVSKQLLNLDSRDSSHCVLMANMHSCLGKWKEVTSYRRLISKRGLIKEPGWSWIDLSG